MSDKLDFDKIEKTARSRKKISNLVIYALLGLWALMVLFPFYWMVLTSIKS